MTCPAILADNLACVRQAAALLRGLDAALYTCPHDAFFGASVGGHVRHNIDHYLSFFRGLAVGRIDYETRERDPALESDLGRAVATLEEIARRIEALAGFDLDAPCSVRVSTDSDATDDPDHWSGSTVRRELQFLLGHAVHHDAQVAAMCRTAGVEPPEGFGMAPSTLRHRARTAAGAGV